MQDEIWHQFGIQNYNGNVLSVYPVDTIQATCILKIDNKAVNGLP